MIDGERGRQRVGRRRHDGGLAAGSAITRNSAPTALSTWVTAVNAGACQGKSVGKPPTMISATGIRSSPLIVIHPNVVASLTPMVAVLRMK